MSQSVVLLERDPVLARSIIGGLRPHFSVHLTHTREELRDNVAQSRPDAVVLNIEVTRLSDVENLHNEFPELLIVCTHRIPDEDMWMAALAAGASDVCPCDDVGNVLSSILRNSGMSDGAAA